MFHYLDDNDEFKEHFGNSGGDGSGHYGLVWGYVGREKWIAAAQLMLSSGDSSEFAGKVRSKRNREGRVDPPFYYRTVIIPTIRQQGNVYLISFSPHLSAQRHSDEPKKRCTSQNED